MSNYNTVLVERDDGIAVVSLNRPASLNAFNAQLRHELRQAVREVNDDPAVRVVILTGAGRAFCAGADLAETGENPASFRVEDQLNGEYKPILLEMNSAPKPWIAAVNGAAAGIGSAFAMNCDLSVMAEDAYLYQAFAAIGLIPDGGATWHLVRTLGRQRAYEVIVSGEKVRAQKCLDWGLCNRVVPAAELMAHTRAWARELAAKLPCAMPSKPLTPLRRLPWETPFPMKPGCNMFALPAWMRPRVSRPSWKNDRRAGRVASSQLAAAARSKRAPPLP